MNSSFGIHRQRNNIIPDASVANTALITDSFAILRSNGTVAPVTQTGIDSGNTNIGFVDFVFAPGGSLQRNFVQNGFGFVPESVPQPLGSFG